MHSTHIGKILLVDDKYDDAVMEAVKTLVKHGMPVQYWDSKGDLPDEINNVRVVILDLDLANFGIRGPGFYSQAAEALHRIPGPFIVILMALDFNEDDPAELNTYYKETYGVPMCGFIAEKGLTKKEELEDPTLLTGLIVSSILQNDILNLLMSWEGAVEKAKDAALSEFLEKELEMTIMALIKSLCRDLGEEAAAREMTNLMMHLVSRKVGKGLTFQNVVNLISKLNKAFLEKINGYPTESDLSLYNKLMFYEPVPEEGVCTGDIYTTEKEFFQYGIVLTPRCDIIQGKTTRVLICYAFPLKEELFKELEYPLHKIDPSVVKRHKNGLSLDRIVEYMKDRYFQGNSRLPANLHILWNFRHEKEIFGICFDFNNVQSVEISEFEKCKRRCRLGSPYIEDMLEKYGSLVSRIGTMEINRSPSQLRSSLESTKKPS